MKPGRSQRANNAFNPLFTYTFLMRRPCYIGIALGSFHPPNYNPLLLQKSFEPRQARESHGIDGMTLLVAGHSKV